MPLGSLSAIYTKSTLIGEDIDPLLNDASARIMEVCGFSKHTWPLYSRVLSFNVGYYHRSRFLKMTMTMKVMVATRWTRMAMMEATTLPPKDPLSFPCRWTSLNSPSVTSLCASMRGYPCLPSHCIRISPSQYIFRFLKDLRAPCLTKSTSLSLRCRPRLARSSSTSSKMASCAMSSALSLSLFLIESISC